jgi:hypothetical protein
MGGDVGAELGARELGQYGSPRVDQWLFIIVFISHCGLVPQ